MTKTEFKRTLKELARRRSVTAAAFDRKGDQERGRRVESCRGDIFEFARIYLPHYYHDKRASFHDEWKRVIEVEGKVVVIAAPRGHGKSAFFTLFNLLKALLYEERKFIIISSDTEAQAKGLLGFIAEELKENERIKEDFAQVLKTANFSASEIIVGTGKVVAKGKGQSLRGLRHGPYRPDTFIGDDLENDAEQRNPARVKKSLDWIKRVVIPSLDPKGWHCIIVGTILSRGSALLRMINEKDEKGAPLFESLVFRAIDEKGRPAWPERFSLPYLRKLKSQIGSFAFQAEYMNDPKDDEHGIKEEWITSWPEKRAGETPSVISIYTDPSVGQSVTHDFKATMVVGLFGKNLDVLWARVRRESISNMIGAVFDLYEKYTTLYPRARVFTGFESNGFQSVLKGAYEEEEQNRNLRIPLFLINNRTSKMLRIESLFSPIERGLIRFKPASGEQNLLIEQIVYLGSSGMHDDAPDALAGAVSLLESKTRNKSGYEPVAPRRTLGRSFPPSQSRNELSEII